MTIIVKYLQIFKDISKTKANLYIRLKRYKF